MKICKNCSSKMPEDLIFCSKCGTSFEQQKKICRNCGNEILDGMSFCGECGTADNEPEPVIGTMPAFINENLSENQKVFCKNCGIELSDGINFCGKCGTLRTASVQSAYQQPTRQSVQPQPTNHQRQQQEFHPVYQHPLTSNISQIKKKPLAAVICAIGGVIMLAVIIVMTTKGNDSDYASAYKENGDMMKEAVTTMPEPTAPVGGSTILVYNNTGKWITQLYIAP